MSEEIIKILDALAEKFGLVINWTSENVIPFLKQLCDKYVNYEVATSVVYLLLGIICLFAAKYAFKLTKFFIKKDEESNGDFDDLWIVMSGIATGVFIIVGIAISFYQIFDIVTCFTFPEKIIIEELENICTSFNH